MATNFLLVPNIEKSRPQAVLTVVERIGIFMRRAAQLLLLVGRQIYSASAVFAAAAFKFFAAIFALDKQQMTGDIRAVAVRVRFLAALMAIADNFLCNLFA